MADNKKITELPDATLPIATGVKFEAVQGGINVKVDADDMPGSGGGTWGSITGTLTDQTDLNTALGLKAPLASPTFTGTPAAPTAAPGTNSTQLATTAFVQPTEADVTLANGVVTIDYSAGDVQHMTISENKVITTISNPLVGKSILVILDGTFSMSFSTITAVVEGQYNAGEENRVFILCTKVIGGVEFRITFDNSLSNAFDVDSAGFIGLTDGATVSWAVGANELFSNRTLTIAGNRTFGAPTGMSDGTVGTCWVTASGATRTINIPAGASHKLKGVGDDTFKTITIPSGETYIISWQYNSALAVWVWWFVD